MLGVTPGYVSKRIQHLESELGCRLFHRSTRRVTLTEQGERTYARGTKILHDAQQLQEDIVASRNELRGVLSVSTSLGFGRRIVGEALAEFSEQYPSIEIRLDMLDQIVDLVKHKIDLDIRVGDHISPHYIARRLADNYRVLCASPLYFERHPAPRCAQDLSTHECLVIRERDHPVGLWKLTTQDKSETFNVKVTGPLVTNNGEIAVAWALAGRGITLRSIWDVQPHLDSGRLVIVLPELRQDANIWAVYPERLSSSAKIKLCVRHLESYFARWGVRESVAGTLQTLDKTWF